MKSILSLVIAFIGTACSLQLGGTRTILRAYPRDTRAAPIMQTEPNEEPAKQEMPAAPSESDGYTTFYDDEREDKVLAAKPQISDSMRQRLINEQRAIGADPNSKNPLLLVFGGVGVFVLLGALAVNL